MEEIQKLINTAKKASHYAQSKYSKFPVGAALVTKNGHTFTGCNIESSSYSLTICAERVALAKALSEGATDFKQIVIYAPRADFCPPCGACRQLLYDYAPDIDVILTNGTDYKIYTLTDLLPNAFEESQLKK